MIPALVFERPDRYRGGTLLHRYERRFRGHLDRSSFCKDRIVSSLLDVHMDMSRLGYTVVGPLDHSLGRNRSLAQAKKARQIGSFGTRRADPSPVP